MNATGSALRRAAFLDRDGVINIDRGYVFRREDFQFVPGVLEGARRLHELGFLLVVTTNQSGIGRGLYTEDDFHALTTWMRDEFMAAGAPLAGVYFCPHHPTEALGEYRRACQCRKPAPGMLLAAARDLGIDLSVLGDVRRQGVRSRGGSRRGGTRSACCSEPMRAKRLPCLRRTAWQVRRSAGCSTQRPDAALLAPARAANSVAG